MRDFLERFLGPDALERFGQGSPVPSRPRQALGSGFIIDPTGYVVTNNHVIDGANSVRIALQDGTEIAATVVGTDPQTDLALLKVDTDRDLPHLDWGDSDTEARVGDWVVAIGNPFGLGGTVTAGIVSARARDIQSGPYDDFIQTDAAINRGNSGGPLISVGGAVVGVNTAIFSPSGGSIGIGFAVPSSVARPVVQQLRESGSVKRGWLGVQIQSVTAELAQAMGLDEAQGALVTDVVEDAPAAAAGIQVGDVILDFAGTRIDELRDLPRAVANYPVGEDADITVWRDGQRRTISTEIAQLKAGAAVAAGAAPSGEAQPATGELGLALARLTAQARQQYGIDGSVQGVLVVRVEADSVAAREGVQPGDVIARVGSTAVSSPEEVARALDAARTADRKSVALLVQRGDQARYIGLPLG
jgi:serine protease Do